MGLLNDIRRGVRSLRRSGGFATASVLTLGTAIALAATAFAVTRGYLLQGLPYPAADRLYSVRYGAPGQDYPRNMESLDWTSLEDVVEHPIAWDLDVFYLLGGDHAESAPGAWVTEAFVEGLGVRPALGRGFDREAFSAGGTNVALISHRLWLSRFGGDPQVAGRTFTAYVSDRPDEAESYTVAGVLPADFWHINPYTDILVPLRAPTYPYLIRLRVGATADQAAARITALVRAGADGVPQDWRARVESTHATYVATLRPVLRAVTGAALLVLLVASANVAGLMLVRATRRRHEIAVHLALGARRGAIARMIFGEALVLGLASSLLALVAADFALSALGPFVQTQLGRPSPGSPASGVDAQAAMAAVLLGLAAALVCTLVTLPAWMGAGLVSGASGSRTMTAGTRSARIRAGLVTLQIAASLALLAGSTLMLRSVSGLLHLDLGFDAERVLNASVTLRQSRYPDASAQAAVFSRIESRLEAIPGVESVALTTAWPVQQPRLYDVSARERTARSTRAAVHGVNASYFATLGIPLAAGRAHAGAGALGAEPVVVVSESLARRLWPDGDALGNAIVVPQPQPGAEPVTIPRRIVGIAADVRQGPADDDSADVYVPLGQLPGRFAFVMLRTSGRPADWVPPLRAAFRDIDPEIAVDRAVPLQTIVDRLTTQPRFLAALLGIFAAAAAMLALVGTYSVIAYAVRQREREIAVRLAVGADPAQVTRLFVRQGAGLLAVGLVLGLAGAVAGGRLIETHLFGVTPRDPLALAGAAIIFGVAGLAAIWWPSRRAARTDPAIALRAE